MAEDAFDVPASTAIKVYPGQRTDVQLQITKRVAAEGIRGYAVEDRQCRFPNEFKSGVLSAYSQKGCLYECALRQDNLERKV